MTMPTFSYNHQPAWNLFAEGKTKGIFQLESNLGKTWSKKTSPTNLEELSALIAIIRPGCVSKDTLITVKLKDRAESTKRHIRVTMEELYLNRSKYSTIVSCDENTGKFIDNKMTNIFLTGRKECFRVNVHKYSRTLSKRITPKKWYDLECTADHKLLTSDGWKQLKDIEPGERIAVTKRVGGRKNMRSDTIGSRHVAGVRVQNSDGSKYYKQICYKNYIETCILCDWSEAQLDVHHLEGDRFTDNSPENLCFVCPNHHREISAGIISNSDIVLARDSHKLQQCENIEWGTYGGCESVGVKDVYDISMEAPHHNFIAGNFVVHNCLNAVTDGKNMAQHYVDRKNGVDPVTYLHPALTGILGSTQGVMIYQEQAMLISQQLAGFNLKEADELRKAIGKKKADLMAQIRKKFLVGCKQQGIVTAEEGGEIFDQVEKSARYLFNKSHSLTYAVDSYMSAWYKSWFPDDFYMTYLEFAAQKSDTRDREIYELISEAKLFDIGCKMPTLECYADHFHKVGGDIVFGVQDIRSLVKKAGATILKSIKEVEDEIGRPASEFTWMEVLLKLGTKIDATSFKALASIGFFATNSVGISRNRALYEYTIFRGLTDAERRWVLEAYPAKKWTNLVQCFTDLAPLKKEGLGGTNSIDRKQIIESEIYFIDNPPYSLEDDPAWIIDQEVKLAGCPISYSRIEAADTGEANTTCKEIMNGKNGKGLCVAGNITRVANVTVKRGKTKGQLMSFLTIEDESCALDGVIVFPETRKKHEYFLYEGNNLLFCGSVSKKDNSFIVDKISEI